MSPGGAGPTLRIRFDIPLCRVGHSPPVRTAIVCTVPPILLLAARVMVASAATVTALRRSHKRTTR